jgi:hypothetical protein
MPGAVNLQSGLLKKIITMNTNAAYNPIKHATSYWIAITVQGLDTGSCLKDAVKQFKSSCCENASEDLIVHGGRGKAKPEILKVLI